MCLQDDSYQTLTHVHVFLNCTQDSATVSSIMEHAVMYIKKEHPELKVFYGSNNAALHGALCLARNWVHNVQCMSCRMRVPTRWWLQEED